MDSIIDPSELPFDREAHYPAKLYRELEQQEQCVIFADPAESQDECAAVVMSKKFYDCPLIFNEVMSSAQFGYELYNLGKYVWTKTGIFPKIAVERNTGQAAIHVLTTLNYPDLFRMVDFTGGASKGGDIGWLTTGHLSGGELIGTRRKMLDDLALAIRQEVLTFYDETQIRQLMSFMVVKGRAQAKANKRDDLCFVKGTLVLTDKGQIPIEQIKVGDRVLTRRGYKSVMVTMNRFEKVVTNIGLTGTFNHPVFTTKGIKCLDKVEANDIIYMWNQKIKSTEEVIVNTLNEKLLSIESRNIIDTQSQNIDNIESISWDTQNGKNHQYTFTVRYGLIILEKFLKDLLSIIKIIMLPITIFPTLLFFPEVNMLRIIWVPQSEENYQASLVRNKVKDYMRVLRFGNKKILSLQNKYKGKMENDKERSQLNILKNGVLNILMNGKKYKDKTGWDKLIELRKQLLIGRKTIQNYLKKQIKKMHSKIFLVNQKQHYAQNAAKVLLIPVSWVQNFVQAFVGNITGKRKVYNLQVADTPEYFANNILVHNCMATAGAWQVHQLTPPADFGDFDEENFASQQDKWRFR